MDAASIEETNRLRVSLGMKPLPVPGAAATSVTFKEASEEDDEDASATMEGRQAQAYDNYKKSQDADAAKKRREEKSAAIKKARDASRRVAQLEGKGLGDADYDDGKAGADAKSWLKSQKKRQKKIDEERRAEQEKAEAEAKAAREREYSAKDLAGVKVGHEMGSFLDGGEQVLTLKDSTIQENEDEGDELENIDLRAKERLEEKLDRKKKTKIPYNPMDLEESGERSLLAQYDEEISGKKKHLFTLGAAGGTDDIADILQGPVDGQKGLKVSLDELSKSLQIPKHSSPTGKHQLTPGITEDAPMSDYVDASEIKVKKPKKKKTKSTRQRPLDEDDIFPLEPAAEQDMDIDAGSFKKKRKVFDDTFVDDEDLQATLSIQRQKALKQRKKTKPEDIARQLKEEAATPDAANGEDINQGGLVIDEISEFVAGIRKRDDSEDRQIQRGKSRPEGGVTAMDVDSDDSDDDQDMKREASAAQGERAGNGAEEVSEDIAATGVGEEKTIDLGIGSTLQLLKERGILKGDNAEVLSGNHRQRQEFLADLNRHKAEFDAEAKKVRERDRASGKLDRFSTRERDEWLRQQNSTRDQQTSRFMAEVFNANYKPNVELKYTDEFGRSMNQKEAFKHLSHQFHGKGSGKGKTDKRLKKIEDEKRREAQSILDSSQSVGMSSATAQQTKKRKEAGVRLA